MKSIIGKQYMKIVHERYVKQYMESIKYSTRKVYEQVQYMKEKVI